MSMKKYALLLLLGFILLTSCKTPQDITYLQDVEANTPIPTQGDGYIRFQPGDKLSIFVRYQQQYDDEWWSKLCPIHRR